MRVRSILLCGCSLSLFAAAELISAASMSSSDKQFLIAAARTDMLQAHEGHMAETQAQETETKTLAKALVQDHTDSYHRLGQLAVKTGVSIPTGIDSGKDPAIRQLVHLKGDSFDRQFARGEIAAARQAIAAYKREAAHGQDPEVKAYANQMIPVWEKQLQLAEQTAKPLQSARAGR